MVVNNFSSLGGGVYLNNSEAVFRNFTISSNTASYFGGGFFIHRKVNPIISNSIFWDNLSEQIYISEWSDQSSIRILYSDIEDGDQGILSYDSPVYYGNGFGEFKGNFSDTNISLDPLFVDFGSGNYDLLP